MSQNKKFDFLIFIGRFQPFHLGHLHIIEQALSQSERVIVFVGSMNCARSLRNPWTYAEREHMIRLSLTEEENKRVIIRNLRDHTYNDQKWIKQVQEQAYQTIINNIPGNTMNVTLHGWGDAKVGLIGHKKDNTSFYLKLFPEWKSVDVEDYKSINGTDIRESLFANFNSLITPNYLPNAVYEYIKDWRHTDEIKDLYGEFEIVENYKKQWADSPYPPVFVTTDAVVVQSGHILLIKRKAHPGKGLLALPGGYINQNELLVDSMIRELREETRIKVPEAVIRGSIKATQVFDNPHRDPRGRLITHAFLIVLNPDVVLPKVKGGDDAAKAGWHKLGNLVESNLYADHYHIIETMIGRI